MAALLQERYGAEVELQPGERGAFEVFVNERQVWSKQAVGRFPEVAEITKHLA